MFDEAGFVLALQRAQLHVRAGELERALATYEQALRRVTPDDSVLRRVIADQDAGHPVRGRCDDPAMVIRDTQVRAEMVAILRELRRFDEACVHARIALHLDLLLEQICPGTPPGLKVRCRNAVAASCHDLMLIEGERNHPRQEMDWLLASEAIDAELGEVAEVRGVTRWRALARAGARARRGLLEEALRADQEAFPLVERTLTPHQVAQHLNESAQWLQNLGEHGEAETRLRRAIRIQSAEAPDHPQLGRLHSNLALLLHERLEFEEADECAARAVGSGIAVAAPERAPHYVGVVGSDRAELQAWMAASERHFSSSGGARRRHDVFISYNRRDEQAVETLRVALEARGLRVWTFQGELDWEQPKTDDQIRQRVFGAIADAHLVVLVTTGTSLTSMFVAEEVHHSLSLSVPVLTWYPRGVRLHPSAAAVRSDTSEEHLRTMLGRLFRPGVHAFYGSGLRGDPGREIARAVAARFARLSPGHPAVPALQEAGDLEGALCPTRLWPVLVDADGQPLFPGLLR
jgi:tetratricopeptide (TPR) repeat protein